MKISNFNLFNISLAMFLIGTLVPAGIFPARKVDQGMGELYNGQDVVKITSFDPVPFFYLPVSINGRKPIMMIVDTGATDTSFSKDDATKLGIVVDKTQHGKYVARTGNGIVDVEKTKIATLKIGFITVHDVRASVLNTAGDSVLGMSLLGRIGHIEIDGSTLTIRSKAHPIRKSQIITHYYVEAGGA